MSNRVLAIVVLLPFVWLIVYQKNSYTLTASFIARIWGKAKEAAINAKED